MKLIKNYRRRKFIQETLNWDNGNPLTNGEYFLLTTLGPSWKRCFDIGANRGEYTKMLRKVVPEAEITSFEPNPDSAKYIKTGRKTGVEVVAVGDKLGLLTINFNRNDDTQSSTYRSNEHTKPTKVPQITIDNYLHSNQLDHIDFIKIDTEGHELAVLKGAKKALNEQTIDLIQFEYGGTYKDADIYLKDIYDLISKNYIICHIMPQGVLPLAYDTSLETYRYSNWLAMSRKIYGKGWSG